MNDVPVKRTVGNYVVEVFDRGCIPLVVIKKAGKELCRFEPVDTGADPVGIYDEKTNSVQCPKCGSPSFHAFDTVRRVWRENSIEYGMMTLSNFQMCWDGAGETKLECDQCKTQFDVPAELEVDFG
jgi:hypothetical protein